MSHLPFCVPFTILEFNRIFLHLMYLRVTDLSNLIAHLKDKSHGWRRQDCAADWARQGKSSRKTKDRRGVGGDEEAWRDYNHTYTYCSRLVAMIDIEECYASGNSFGDAPCTAPSGTLFQLQLWRTWQICFKCSQMVACFAVLVFTLGVG